MNKKIIQDFWEILKFTSEIKVHLKFFLIIMPNY
jgi:hypothetical protein